MRLGSIADFRVIGRHPDFLGARQARPLGDAHDHRLAAEIEQRLGRQRVDA
jgi:hypothetical protein